ncbi:MAG: putative peptidoglycan glycosyltransferase FtsW [Candidatus Limnocylindrales bacterium]
MTANVGRRRAIMVPPSTTNGRLSRRALPVLAPARRETAASRSRLARGPQRERHEPDYLVLVLTFALTAIGLLMIYSSLGVQTAIASGGDPFSAVAPQLIWSFLGVVALVGMMRLDYRYLRLASVPFFIMAVVLLAVTILPAMGPIQPIVVGQSARWLKLGPLPPMHPAEIAKLALVVYLAHWLAKRGTRMSSFWHGILPFLIITGTCLGLVALEPDLGTTGVLTLAAFTMVFVAGARLLHLLVLAPLGVAAVVMYVLRSDYQMERVHTFIDPWSDPLRTGFQTVQGLYSLALGGLTGTGLGESRLPGGLSLPNASNDFIFAVIGQEFGFLGAGLVILLFLFLAYRGVRIALRAPDTFGGLLATGITAWLTFQALINIGVVVNLLPITGIPLPFVSDGGSSLVVSFAAVGILLSISRETQSRGTWNDAHPDRGRGYGRTHLPSSRGPALPG